MTDVFSSKYYVIIILVHNRDRGRGKSCFKPFSVAKYCKWGFASFTFVFPYFPCTYKHINAFFSQLVLHSFPSSQFSSNSPFSLLSLKVTVYLQGNLVFQLCSVFGSPKPLYQVKAYRVSYQIIPRILI